MKMAKRIVSVILAATMLLGCFSLAASANYEGKITLDVVFYKEVKETVDGAEVITWEPLTDWKVAEETNIRARIFVDTDYAVGDNHFFFMYPTSFMTYSEEGLEPISAGSNTYVLPMSTNSDNPAIAGGWSYVAVSGTGTGIDDGPVFALTDDGTMWGEYYDPYVPASYFEGYGWVDIYTQTGKTAKTLSSGGDDKLVNPDKYYLFDLQFTVNKGATGEGFLRIPEGAFQTPDRDLSLVYMQKATTSSFALDLIPGAVAYYDWNTTENDLGEMDYISNSLTIASEEPPAPETYTVTFKQSADGEEITSIPDLASGAKIDAEEFVIAAEELEIPDGKEFAYWTLLDGVTKVDENYEITEDITLIPFYNDVAPATFTVTFKQSADGEEITSIPDLASGAKIDAEEFVIAAEELEIPDGKEFAYWTLLDGVTKVDENYEITEDIILIPFYNDVAPETFSVRFEQADGTEITTLPDLVSGSLIEELDLKDAADELDEVEGKHFTGWVLKGTETAVTAGYEVTTDLVLVPVYADNTYTVTYEDGKDGEISSSPDVLHGTELTAEDLEIAAEDLPDPEDGKAFAGWKIKGTDTVVAAGYAVKSDLVLVPYYTNIKYTVTFYADEAGTVPYEVQTDKYEYNNPLDYPAGTPTAPEGHKFEKWSVAEDTAVTGDISVTPIFEKFTYKVEFKDADGKVVHTLGSVAWDTVIDEESIAAAEDKLPSLEGKGLKYTGWDGDTSAAIKAETVFTATTDKEAYTVKFVTGIDGVTVSDLPVAFDEDITAKLEQLSVEGLNFKGWVADLDTKAPAATKIADLGEDGATVTYYAYWTKTVTFVDGETETPVDVDKDASILANAPAFAGKGDDYEAGVWYDAANGAGNELTADAKATADAAATYYAYYAPKTDISYTIAIYEEKLENEKVEGEDAYVFVENITVENATAGEAIVYTDARTGFKAPVLEPADAIVANGITVKAYYDRIDDITITVDGEPKDYEYGETLNPEAPETEEGQEFDKWVDKDGNEVKVPITVTPDMDNLELIATYKYVITFIDQGTTTKNDAQAEGATIEAPAETGKDDYDFKGWFTAENGAGEKLTADAKVTGAVTYYAHYTAKTGISYSIEIYEEILGKDGEYEQIVEDTVIVTDGVAGEAIVYNEARTGFKAPVLEPADAIVANGIVVKAYYDRIDDITITVDGEPKDYEYGETLNPEVPETEEGQEFDKWVDKDGNEVKVPTTVTPDMDNLELIATYKYVITFIVNGETVKNDAQAEGAAIVAPADPSIKGYAFGGWFTAENGAGENLAADAKVTGVATYYAQLTVIKSLLTFTDKDGSVIGTPEEVEYGADLNALAPAAPEVVGQTFVGWVDAVTGAPMPSTMGDVAATYKPSYSNNSTVKYTVETYFMDADGNYEQAVDIYAEGILGTKVTAESKEYAGYYLDTEKSVMSTDSLAAGTVLKAYYAREIVTVTFVDYDGITVLGEYTGLFGSKIEYPADPTREFHTFAGWDATPVTAPVTDLTITATYKRVPVVLVNNETTVEGKNVVFNRDDAEMMYIHGFMVNDIKNADDYDRYLAVEGDGYFKVVPVTNGKYGTGTKIELYDNYDGKLLATYFIVIYGDVDGDANVTSNDISIARDEALGKTWWSDPESDAEDNVNKYNPIRVIAADITGEGNVKNNDVSAITAQVNTTAEINQSTREVIYNS